MFGSALRQKRQKRITLLLSSVLAVLVLLGMPRTAWAGGWPERILTDLQGTHVIYLRGVKGDAKLALWGYTFKLNRLSGAKSSNPSVLTVDDNPAQHKYNGKYSLMVLARNPGRSTVTYSYKGKQYRANVIVKKYAKPVQYITIGSRKITTAFCSKVYAFTNWDTAEGKKFSVTPHKGWKLERIQLTYLNSKDVRVFKTVKNGAKLPAKIDDAANLIIQLKNTKDGGIVRLYIYSK